MMDQVDNISNAVEESLKNQFAFITRPKGRSIHIIAKWPDTGRFHARTLCSMHKRFSWVIYETLPVGLEPCERCWERGAAKGWVNTL
jgi:hypothetical protein